MSEKDGLCILNSCLLRTTVTFGDGHINNCCYNDQKLQVCFFVIFLNHQFKVRREGSSRPAINQESVPDVDLRILSHILFGPVSGLKSREARTP